MHHAHNYRDIDLANWKRRRHYGLYAECDYPYIGITSQLDITRFYRDCAARERKFFTAFLHRVTEAMNSVENLRYRIHDGKVALFDRIDPSFVVLDREEELFYFATPELGTEYDAFATAIERAKKEALAEKCLFNDRLDVAYVTCTPWFSFTDSIHPLNLSRNDSIPRIMWGKVEEREDSAFLSFYISCHHGLVDGIHIGKFFQAITEP